MNRPLRRRVLSPAAASRTFAASRTLAALGVLAAAGCAVVTADPPTVGVASVRLEGVGLTEQQLGVVLCVTNPNATELAFSRIEVGMDVSGAALAGAASDRPVRLPPLSSTLVPFTAVTTVRNLGTQLLGIVRTGGLDYRLHGTVTLQGGLALTLPFSRSGRLDPLSDGLGFAAAAADPEPSACARPPAAS